MKLTTRLAKMKDLNNVNELFKGIIKDMHLRNVTIWSDYYPFFMFPNDIKNEQMYLVENETDIVAIFVLANQNNGELHINWENKTAKVRYLDRFAVNVNYLRQGIGMKAINIAEHLSKQLGASYLRLFVVGENTPAINLYEKCQYKKKDGLYILEEDPKIRMFGYEKFLN